MRQTTIYAVVLAAGGLWLGGVALRGTGSGAIIAGSFSAFALITSVVIWRRHRLGPALFGLMGIGLIVLGLVNHFVLGSANVIVPIVSGLMVLPGYKFLRDDLGIGRQRSAGKRRSGEQSEPRARFREDCRPLRELCEDSTARLRLHHSFAHGFWPQYVQSSPDGVLATVTQSDADVTKYVQSRWAYFEHEVLKSAPEGEPGVLVFRRVADLEAWVETVAGHPALIIKMPVPEKSPHAYFIGALFRSEEGDEQASSARVFTLERTEESVETGEIDAPALFCEWTEGRTHLNYELPVLPMRKRFASTIEKVVNEGITARVSFPLHSLLQGPGS